MKGIVRLLKTKQDHATGKTIVTDDRTLENDLTFKYFSGFVNNETSDQRPVADTLDIWISEYDLVGVGAEMNDIQSSERRQIIGSRNSYTYTQPTSTTPGIHQYSYTFNPPSTTRTIRTISLEDYTVLSIYNDPCIQETTETLTIFYNVIQELANPIEYPNFSPSALDVYQQFFWLRNSGVTDALYPDGAIGNLPAETYNSPDFSEKIFDNYRVQQYISASTADDTVGWQTNSYLTEDGYVQVARTYDSVTTNNGKLLGALCFEGNNLAGGLTRRKFFQIADAQNILPSGASKVQNTFSRNALDVPFSYESSSVSATGSGSLEIDDNDTWTGPDGIASKYKIEITSGGDVSAGEVEYRLYKQYHTGDRTGTGYNTPLPVSNQPGLNSRIEDYSDQHGVPSWDVRADDDSAVIDNVPNIVTFRIPEFISWDKTGLTFNSIEGKPQVHLDSTTQPTFTATSIMQVEVFSDYEIVIACRTSGLWRVTWDETLREIDTIVNVAGTSAIGLDQSKCWGVQVKRSDQSLWAIYSNTANDSYVLVSSTNRGSNWTAYDSSTVTQFSIPGLTDNASTVYPISLHIDPVNPNDRFMIAFNTAIDGALSTASCGDFAWWSRAGSAGGTTDANVPSYTLLNTRTYIGAKFKSTSSIQCSESGIWIMLRDSSGSTSQSYEICFARFNEEFYEDSAWALMLCKVPLAKDDGEEILFNGDINTLLLTSDWATTITSPITSSIINSTVFNPNGIINNFEDCYGPATSASTIDDPGLSVSYMASHLGANLYLVMPPGFGDYELYYNDVIPAICARHTGNRGTIETGEYELWGWNGSSWEKGNTNSRTAAVARQNLIDGLAVTFSGSGLTSFVTGESYDTYVYNGVLKDNATTVENIQGNLLIGFQQSVSVSGSTIPAAPGTTVTEPLYSLYSRDSRASDDVPSYSRNGYHWASDQNGNLMRVTEQELSGDFEIRITPVNYYKTQRSFADDLGNITVAETTANLTNYLASNNTEFESQERFVVRYPSSSSPVGEIAYACRNDGNTANAIQGVLNDYTPNDAFVYSVSSGTATWSFDSAVNGVSQLYISPVSRTNNYRAVINHKDDNEVTYSNCEVTFTENRCLVDIGNSGSQTGRFDPSFRKIVTAPPMRDQNVVLMDGIEVVVNYETTIPPGPGEVNLLPYSGRLWCNPVDAGKTIDANFLYVRDFN